MAASRTQAARLPALPVAADDDGDVIGEPAAFDAAHYPRGPNGDFLLPVDGLDLIDKYAGSRQGGGGKFEDPERRDIAKGVAPIIAMLHSLYEGGTVPANARILDVGAGTGLLLKPLATLVPAGALVNSEISPDFRAWLGARIEAEGLSGNASVVCSTPRDPHPNGVAGSIDLALMVDVYHHIEFPRAVGRRLRALLDPHRGRLVVIDFFRDPLKVTSHPPEWVMAHLRAGQEVFRAEVEGCGFALVSEPNIPELKENYVMVFRPLSDAEFALAMAAKVGQGWAIAPVPVMTSTPGPTPGSTPGPTPVGVIKELFAAMEASDGDAALACFHAHATMVTVTPEGITAGDAASFATKISGAAKGSLREDIVGTPAVHVCESALLATVWCDYVFLLNRVKHHGGSDAFTLVRTSPGDPWRILHVVDTRRGC